MSENSTFELAMGEVDQLVRLRRYPEVISLCTDLVAQFPHRFEPHFRRAHAWLSCGKGNLAIDDLTAAIAKNSSEPALFFFRGRWRIEAQLVAEGIQDLNQSIVLELGLNSEYYLKSARFSCAIGLYLMGDFAKASGALVDFADDVTTFLAGRLWNAGSLRKEVESRLRRVP